MKTSPGRFRAEEAIPAAHIFGGPVLLVVSLTIAVVTCAEPALDISRELTPRDVITAPGFEWVRDSVGIFRIYAEEGSAPADRIAEVKSELSLDVTPRIEQILGRGIPDGAVHVFLVESRSDMKRLIGWAGNGISGDELVLSIFPDDWSGLGDHEFMHVATARLFGSADGYGAYALNEGVAVYASGEWWGHDLHALTKYLRATNRGLTVRELLDEGQRHPESTVYPQAGSLVAFLHERFGADKLATLLERQYRSSEPRLEQILGMTIRELDAEWAARVSAADTEGIRYDP